MSYLFGSKDNKICNKYQNGYNCSMMKIYPHTTIYTLIFFIIIKMNPPYKKIMTKMNHRLKFIMINQITLIL